MGNQPSSESSNKDTKSLAKTLDFIATNFILTQNFQDMKNLADINYCNNLVILTSNVLQDQLNEMDINYLSQRLKGDEEINEMRRDKIMFFNKENVSKMDVKNATDKKRMCIGIAKFYIKIAHLFASIVTTINPTYIITDSYGSKKTLNLFEKKNLPPGINTQVENLNLCSNRIKALINKHDYNVNSPDQEVSVRPEFCKMNVDNSRSDGKKKLYSEVGIPELEQLYFDKYNYNEGRFGGKQNMEDNMTPETYKQYQNDLLLFYKAFTGNNEIPMIEKIENSKVVKVPAITKFSQIPLRSYHTSKGCDANGIFTKEYKGTFREKLFYDYAQHIKTMIEKTEVSQQNLLGIIDKLFVYNIESGEKKAVINPSLTEEVLQKLIEETRGIIVGLYLTCEEDFVKGLNLFEAIIETQIKQTSVNQILELEKALDKTLAENKTDIDAPVSQDEIMNNGMNEEPERISRRPLQNQPPRYLMQSRDNQQAIQQVNQPGRQLQPPQLPQQAIQPQQVGQPLRPLQPPPLPPQQQMQRANYNYQERMPQVRPRM
jgi:hypothetical protein